MTTCPQGHQSSSEDYCDVCGAPMGPAVAAPPTPTPPAPAPAAPATRDCPHCGASNVADALFCEACGYDFTTGTMPRPEASSIPTPTRPDEVGEPAASIPPAPAPTAAAADPAAPPSGGGPTAPASGGGPAPAGSGAGARAEVGTPPAGGAPAPWVAEIWIDPDWYALQDSADPMPSPGLPEVVPLRGRSLLIGRVSRSRGIHPDIDCEADSGVSRRQAQLTTDGTRWFVEDLQSANGTFVGPASGPLPATPIPPGQRVQVGEDDRLYVGAWTRMVLRRAAPGEVEALG